MEQNQEESQEQESNRLNRWRGIVKEFEQSGKSRQEFSDRCAIKVHQLIYWQSRLKELAKRSLHNPPPSKQSFTPQTKSSQETFTLAINGILVKVPKSTPSEKVIAIIRCLI